MPKNKDKKLKPVIIFILYMTLFTAVTAPFYVFRGPFTSLKKVVVATIMGTRHQYLATTFLSTAEINKITNKSNIKEDTKVSLADINIANKSSNEIVRYNLHPDSGRYDGYLLEIPNPLKVKIAYSKNLRIEGEKTSEMAKRHNAVAAINGGSFTDNNKDSFGGTGAYPGGFLIINGKVHFNDSKDTTKQSVTAFTDKGKLIVGNYSVNELKKLNVRDALCFRPPVLIIKGKGQINDENAAADGFQPRTAIGQTADGTILFLVMDGRANLKKSGATLKDIQDELLKHGAVNASNLDGGFSSTMYQDGALVNSPHGWNGERYVATSIYVEP
ncbi:phosphodiester glycosidase family protein [Clostridium estertheticum]|uniref:phosphodiester glycosidase family protein n=1 Tax=Clostridium estertheticum TaxID=238834 RepID=UPI001C0CB8AA|nr:phosphodiester glycosidase family protein [Clostridium estertheticum]MBU3073614.1 phosphodiester glycosidase family protein [Clostridium estertheticum]MBU3163707.1 phosphodiester glycosidase family protein [Clostridium estertheticum]MBU3172201.1 phosphodiester glycosidase family protein [Clostridium estertheticum]